MTRCCQLGTAGDRWLLVLNGHQGIGAQSPESDGRRIGFAQRRTKTDLALTMKHALLPTQDKFVADLAIAVEAHPGSVTADIGQHKTPLTQMKPRVQARDAGIADDELRFFDSPKVNGHFLRFEP